MYFLTSMFHNKFGGAVKYYDEKGWHWMLNSDKPILFAGKQEAETMAAKLIDQVESNIQVKEITVHENVYEHKMSEEEYARLRAKETLYEMSTPDGKNRIFLSPVKQTPDAKPLEGLYAVDKKSDFWIYCAKGAPKAAAAGPKPEHLIIDAHEKLKEAKALMQILDYEKTQIAKLDGVMMFVAKIMKSDESYQSPSSAFADNPDSLVLDAFEKLQDAKVFMQKLGYEKGEIAKVEGVMLFVDKIAKK